MKWFKHDSDANMDGKLQEILLDYGLEGYGLYWYCIELITLKVTPENITFELEHDARIIARNTGSTLQKVQEMMTRFVDLGLFENSGGAVSCVKIASRIDKSMTSNPTMRMLIENLKKSHDKNNNSHDSIMSQSEKPMQDEIRLDKNRINIARPSLADVKEYCGERKSSVDPEAFLAYYESIGWVSGKNKKPIKNWKMCVVTWEKRDKKSTPEAEIYT